MNENNPLWQPIRACVLACLLSLASACAAPLADDGTEDGCSLQIAGWLDPGSGRQMDVRRLFARLVEADMVLLGETHTSAAHHRWQLYMLSALHSRHPDLVVGFEMFPRAAQPVLDAWSAGELDEHEFLQQSRWREVWGYDAALYLPLLHFVREHRLPAVAMNVDRGLVSRVGDEGWQAVPESEREGVSDPAPASDAYRESLARLYRYKWSFDPESPGEEEVDLEAILADAGFNRFVEAQLTWDRAMAEALAAARESDPDALVVGIVGRGHLEHGHGIPHQLQDLGIGKAEVLLPFDAGSDCADLSADLASAVFVVESSEDAAPRPRARLGVLIEDAEGGVRVNEVVEDSVAAASGIRAGDVIRSAAGFETATTSVLIEVVQRQAPGTWLPLRIERDGELLDITARFPQSFE